MQSSVLVYKILSYYALEMSYYIFCKSFIVGVVLIKFSVKLRPYISVCL